MKRNILITILSILSIVLIIVSLDSYYWHATPAEKPMATVYVCLKPENATGWDNYPLGYAVVQLWRDEDGHEVHFDDALVTYLNSGDVFIFSKNLRVHMQQPVKGFITTYRLAGGNNIDVMVDQCGTLWVRHYYVTD